MKDCMELYTRAALNEGGISKEQAFELLEMPEKELFASATAIRERFFGNKVEICYIINAKSGNCGMNCKFCSQSGHNSADVETYPFSARRSWRRLWTAGPSIPCIAAGW